MSTSSARSRAASLLGMGAAVALSGLAAPVHATQNTATNSELVWADGRYWTEMNPDGSLGQFQVRVGGNGFVYGTDAISEVAISPDGSTAAFVHTSPGAPVIWISDADGQNARTLPSGPQMPSNVAFSADGKKVFYNELNPSTGKVEIFSVPVDGSTNPTRYMYGTYDLGQIVFSANDRFAVEDQGGIDLYVTSTMTRLKSVAGLKAPRFSPDGSKLLAIDTATGDMVAMASDGTGRSILVAAKPAATPPTSVSQAAWSPDGKRVVYTLLSNRSGLGLPNNEQIFEQDAVVGAPATSVGPVQPAGVFGHITWSTAHTPPPVPTPTPTPTPTPVGSPGQAAVHRIGGGDRYATGRLVSQAQWKDGTAGAVVLARGDQAPDALAGVPLAARVHGPLLLTDPQSLDAQTRAEIDRVLGGPGSKKTVYILGGVNAVSPTIENSLRTAGYTVVRHGGQTRFATALDIATEFGSPTRVILATGRNFPDALAAGPLGAVENAPIVLSDDRHLDPATAAYLRAHPTIDAVGGQAVSALADVHGAFSARDLQGRDRYETASAVAAAVALAVPGHTPASVGVASGQTFPDALTGGALAANAGEPLLLTDTTTLPGPTGTQLATLAPHLVSVAVFGGPTAVSDSAFGAIVAAVHGRAA